MSESKKFLELVTKTRQSHTYDLYVKDSISSFDGISTYFNTLKKATSKDEVNVYINSGGGSLPVSIELLDAMEKCKAPITTHAVGRVASAATFLFLAGDVREIYDSAYFMFHQYSAGATGKGDDILQKTTFLKKHYSGFFKKYYKEIFNKEEINKLLDGKDIYLNKKQMLKRLKKEDEDV